MHILMLAAENGAVPGAKVGGIADVVRDVPRALTRVGHTVTVLLPGYAQFSHLPEARPLHTLTVEFGGALETLELFELRLPREPAGLRCLILEHPLFGACGAGQVYCHDVQEPFATDAVKFALFCQGAAYALTSGALGAVDLIHAHDWHAATLLLLRRFHPAYSALRDIPTVFTIHNLSLQGIRPWRDSWSSPERWFPRLHVDRALLGDPRWSNCVNLMRIGINLADQVHVVSPTYAREIIEPSIPELGLIRGEGLELDLRRLSQAGKLHGILNGCEYPPTLDTRKPGKQELTERMQTVLERWVGRHASIKAAWFHALRRVHEWHTSTAEMRFVVSSVGRLTPQKISLLQVDLDGASALDHLLGRLNGGLLVMLGSGETACEDFMSQTMQRHDNFLYLAGYDEALGDMLYRYGDLFLMPSTFEPCGISQMLAMRAGTPCLVHKVGGLADTVQHRHNGFVFDGANPEAQARAMLQVFDSILALQGSAEWTSIRANAAATRFTWDTVIAEYERQLYGIKPRLGQPKVSLA
ncbi:MAG: glycogen/starch synthase [Pseudomonadales bacterium]|jgi:starch synthase|nr:glycogen/starch synthase [Pseudomonadales bacterium]